jgi:polyisoprenoid-binding protein YceI
MRTMILGFVAGTALITAGCSNPAKDKPEAKVAEAVETTSHPAAGAEYVLGEGSTIGFVGSKVTGSETGGFRAFQGSVHVVDGDVTKSTVDITIDTTSIWAGNDRLTGHLKSPDFFEVETYPTAHFQSTSIQKIADGYMVTGNLELHGVTKSIQFPAQITLAKDRVTASAEFSLMRFDFNIEYKGAADNLVRDQVVVSLDVVATPAGV